MDSSVTRAFEISRGILDSANSYIFAYLPETYRHSFVPITTKNLFSWFRMWWEKMRTSDSLATMPTCTNSEIFRKPENKNSHQSVRIIILNSQEGMRIRKKLEGCELFFSVRIRTGPSDLKNWYPIRKPSENHQKLNPWRGPTRADSGTVPGKLFSRGFAAQSHCKTSRNNIYNHILA